MANEREFHGKDLDEALRAAATALRVPDAELHYEIVDQGRRGVFGLGAKEVRIRVIPPLDELPRVEDPVDVDTERPRRDRPEHSREARAEALPAHEIPAEELRALEETLRRMLELMALELSLRIERSGEGVEIKLSGPDEPMLTAKDGDLLLALQFLLSRMARRAWPSVGALRVTCGGKRLRRDDDLIEMVREVAEQVARTGSSRRLQPMNAYERRLVHLTVREFEGLDSRSEGDGPQKRVRIARQQSSVGA